MSSIRARARAVLRALGDGPWGFVLAVWAASRAFFFVVGAIAERRLSDGEVALVNGVRMREPAGALNYWANWDGAWYSGIALHGYDEFMTPLSTNFFPLIPLLIRTGMTVGGGPAVWGVAISTLGCLFALFFLYRTAEALWSTRVAAAATLAFAFFPTAFFMNAVYTDGVVLALTTGSVWAARVRGDLLLAGAFAGVATAGRHLALFLVVPLGVELLRRREFRWRSILGVALVPAGMLAYMLFLWRQFGDPLLFREVAKSAAWARDLADPVETLSKAWTNAKAGAAYLADPGTVLESYSQWPANLVGETLGIAFLVLALLLLALGLWLLPPSLWLYAAALLEFPVLYPSQYFGLFGYVRYVLAAFPIYFVLGVVLAKSRFALAAWVAASAVLGAFLTALFTSWRFVG